MTASSKARAMAKKRTANTLAAKSMVPGPAWLLTAAVAVIISLVVFSYGQALGILPDAVAKVVPSFTELLGGDTIEVYDYDGSFQEFWKRTHLSHGACWRTADFHSIPFSVERTSTELDVEALREHLLEREAAWLALPVRDWKDSQGPAYNTTTARYDAYNVLRDAESVVVIRALKAFIKRSVRQYLECVARSPEYFDAALGESGEYFAQILQRMPPLPLYIMCWANIYREGQSLHWHVHNWPFQGYLSVASEGSSTLFRSSVDPSRRWRFEHKSGLLFILPGGTLHSTSNWTNAAEPRVTVAFNIAPPQNARPDHPELFNRYTWVELFTAEEVRALQDETWAMIVRRPPNRYRDCMFGNGVCV